MNLLSYSARGQKSDTDLTGLKSVPAGLSSFPEALKEDPLPCVFHLLKASHIPWLMALFLHLQSQQWPMEYFSNCIMLTVTLLSLSFVRRFGPTQIIKDNLFILRSLD